MDKKSSSGKNFSLYTLSFYLVIYISNGDPKELMIFTIINSIFMMLESVIYSKKFLLTLQSSKCLCIINVLSL